MTVKVRKRSHERQEAERVEVEVGVGVGAVSLPCDICGQRTWTPHDHQPIRDQLEHLTASLRNLHAENNLLTICLTESFERINQLHAIIDGLYERIDTLAGGLHAQAQVSPTTRTITDELAGLAHDQSKEEVNDL